MDTRWGHPFTCLVSGPTGCGKSVFVKRLVEHAQALINPPPQRVVWCYGEWQPLYGTLSGVQFEEGMPNPSTFDPRERALVVVDDLMAEADERVTKLFTKGSHHRNISVVYIVQNLFNKAKDHRTISLNAHYLVLFKNPRDGSQITTIAKQMAPGRTQYVREAFEDATAEPHGYLLVDFKQGTPDPLRLRTRIFPGEIQLAYLPKS